MPHVYGLVRYPFKSYGGTLELDSISVTRDSAGRYDNWRDVGDHVQLVFRGTGVSNESNRSKFDSIELRLPKEIAAQLAWSLQGTVEGFQRHLLKEFSD